MKNKILLGSIFAFSLGTAQAQQYFNGSPVSPVTDAYRNAKTGFGMTSAPTTNMIEVQTTSSGDGIRVTQTYQSSCALHLDNNSTGGEEWSAYSYGYGDGVGAGNFGIQNSNKSTPDFKIYPSGNVELGGSTSPVTSRFYVSGGANAYGGLIQNISSNNGSLYGLAASTDLNGYTGVGAGLNGYALSPSTSAGTDTRGVWGQAVSGYNAYGGYFEAASGTNNIGVYASGSNWAGYFSGTVYASSGYVSSDNRFKTNIKHIENASEKLKKLKGYTYMFKTAEFKDRNFETTEQIGLIAQELKEVFPNLVKDDGKGYLAVNYVALIPVMVEGFKEQQTTIEQQAQQLQDQQKQIDELKTMVQSLAGHTPAANAQTVELSDKNAIVLNQNVPNPFAESTVISYNIPTDFARAQLIFSTDGGKVIRVINITTKGEGRVNVFANDLSSGLYTYSLVVDGKTIETKRMVKQ